MIYPEFKIFDPQKYYDKDYIDQNIQLALVSGENIKTINNQSLLGSGNIDVGGGSTWDTEIIECNITSVDTSGVATVDNPNWAYEAAAAYNANKLPVVKGSYGYCSFAIPITVTEGSPYYDCKGSTATTIYIGSGQSKTYVFDFSTSGSSRDVYVKELQEKLQEGTSQQVHTNEVAATLSPEIVHVFAGTTDTLAVTLTAPTDALSHLYTMILTTGTTPAVTIQVSDSTAIIYPDDYAIEAGTTYEISVLCANGKYYLRYVTYQEA